MAEAKSIECRHCGKIFSAPNSRFKACSRECIVKAHEEKVRRNGGRPRKKHDPAPTKVCGYCNQEKPGAAFFIQRNHPTGLSYACRACAKIAKDRYMEENRPEVLARRREWYERNAETARTESRRRYWLNYGQNRETAWRNWAGIDFTWDQYLILHEQQGGRCAICSRPEDDMPKKLAADHDHLSGRVRGLLCDDCNLGLGRLQDSPDVLRRAIDYLNAH